MSITINASLYAADAADDSDPTPITLTATGTTADAAWDELRTRIASVLDVESLGDVEQLDDDEDAPADVERGTIDGHYIEWTITKKAPAKNAIPNGKLSTREVAEQLDIAPARLRVFLRSQGDRYTPPGSGGRYSFTKVQVTKIRKELAAWEAKAKAEKAAALAAVAEETAKAIVASEE